MTLNYAPYNPTTHYTYANYDDCYTICSFQAQTSSLVITEEQFFTSGFSSLIDTKILEEHLIKYGVLDEGSLPATQGLRDRWIMVHGPDAMDYVMYRLGKKENGLQLLYQSLRQTQHTYFPHMRIVWELETGVFRDHDMHV